MAFIGDSLTAYRSGGGGFIRYLERRCPESTFINHAIGGSMTVHMRRRLPKVFDGTQLYPFTHVVVLGGVNDLYSNLTAARTNEKIQADLTQVYERARREGAKVIALTVSPWGGFKRYFNEDRGANTVALNRWILEQEGALVDTAIDLYPLLQCQEPHQLCPEFVKPFNDGLHFGPAAHELIGKALFERAFSDCL